MPEYSRFRFITLFVLAAILLGACFMTGCGTKKERKIKIGFLVKYPDEKWFQDEWRFARKCADANGFELFTIGTTDGEKVLAAIDNLAAKGVQGFVICIPDVRLGPAVMARASASNMKVIAVDDQFVGADGGFMDVPYMGIAARSIGETVGRALADEMKKRGWNTGETAAAAITFDELNTLKERTDGAASALEAAGFPKDKIFRSNEKTTDQPGAFDAANTLLTQHPEVRRWLVFSVNDEGVLGAVRAMENRGFGWDTVIGIGIGGQTAIEEFRKDTPTGFFGSCLLNCYRHGYETTELMYKWIRDGVEPPKDTRTEGIMIYRDNYLNVMAEHGFIDDLSAAASQDSAGMK